MTTKTTAKLPATCIDCGHKLTARNRASVVEGAGPQFNDMCGRCYVRSGLENAHNDGHHDHELPVANCPLCEARTAELAAEGPDVTEITEDDDTEMDDIPGDTIVLVTTQTATKSPVRRYIDHRGHGHPLTPKARAVCRAAGGNGIPTPEPEHITIGRGTAVHMVGTDTDVACGAKARGELHHTDDAVTCKNCLKLIK